MKKLRCAIYTRKSSEEGLEQSFNSLDAQREACEAYILSQKSEGWAALPALDQTPDPAMLVRMAGELQVRPEYFLRSTYESDRPTFLRSLSSTLVRDLAYQKAQMQWLHPFPERHR
jgi:superoxide dismutase